MSYLETRRLTKRFDGKLVLDELSLRIPSGQIVGIFGPNGAGKTTALRMISGRLRIDSGEVWINDRKLYLPDTSNSTDARIGHFPEEHEGWNRLVSMMTRGTVELRLRDAIARAASQNDSARNANLGSERQQLRSLLERLRLVECRHTPLRKLSAGENRRLSIALCLCSAPEFLLLDEPFTNVEPLGREAIRSSLHELRNAGIGILITDHQVEDVLAVADDVYYVSRGRLMARGAPEDIIQHPATREYFGGGASATLEDYTGERHASLEGIGLVKRFGLRRVVDDVDLDLRSGEVVGLLGPNGAGKTTIFRILAGMIRPDAGKVHVSGLDVSKLAFYQRARKGLAFCPQYSSVYRKLSVAQNLLATMEIAQVARPAGQRLNRKQRHQRVDEMLERFSLTQVRKSRARTLSGGERRRLEIARCLIIDPEFILLDEPFAGIDPITVQTIQDILRDLRSEGVPILLTDHAVRETMQIADRAFIIAGGQILVHGNPNELVQHPEVRAQYLGDDYAASIVGPPSQAGTVTVSGSSNLGRLDTVSSGQAVGDGGAATGDGEAHEAEAMSVDPLRLHGRYPHRVRANQVFVIEVLVTSNREVTGATLRPLDIPTHGAEVLLVISAVNFTLFSENFRKLRVFPNLDSDWQCFELRSNREGIHRIEVTAYARGQYLGSLPIEITVDSKSSPAETASTSRPLAQEIEKSGAITLRIDFDEIDQIYRYTLVDDSFGSPFIIKSSRLRRPPAILVEDFVTQLNRLARGEIRFNERQTREWLIGKGTELWRELIPTELQELYWERHDGIREMLILTRDDPTPWEALYPLTGQREAGFLVEQFPVARWIPEHVAPATLLPQRAHFVVPSGSPDEAEQEIQQLRAALARSGVDCREPTHDLDGLLDLFANGDFDVLHFACHNIFIPESPTGSGIMMGRQPFQTTLLERHVDRFSERKPLVFMNACRSGSEAPNYTRLWGWAESFIGAGSGAFLGSLWEVTDTSANEFAQEFYRQFMAGNSLGEAVRSARMAIQRSPGDPTWLAYTLYGNPNAHISPQKKGPA